MRGSLRLRLAVWCGGIICSVVLLVALYGYAVASRTQYDELDDRVRSVTGHVAGEYAGAATVAARARVLAGADELGVSVALYDSTGSALRAESQSGAPSASDRPAVNPGGIMASPPRTPYGWLVALAPAIHHTASARGVFGLVENGTRRWRVYVLPVDQSGFPDGRAARYAVGTALLSSVDTSLKRVWYFMMLLAFAGNVVTFATGWLLAGRALRPVRVLTEAASTIARSGAFSQRVPAESPRDELGRLAETFNEMLERLERVHSSQARFVSDASHELRAPLAVIQANLELLAHQPAMSQQERQAAVTDAHAEAARLGRLVADLLVLARADVGVPTRREPVDLDRVVMDVLGEVRHLKGHRSLEIVILEPIVILGDADRLTQLILNLVENAIKYTPDDGRITVAIRRVGENAEIEIRDTGIGIAASDLPRVFERFYRADPARARRVGGTGLGLSIALWIARQHGGEVVLSSALGQGTSATVRLPLPA